MYYMADQQVPNLYPFVYEAKVVDDNPVLSQLNPVIGHDNKIYFISQRNTELDISVMQRQDFHYHYFGHNTVATITLERIDSLATIACDASGLFVLHRGNDGHTLIKYSIDPDLTQDWVVNLEGGVNSRHMGLVISQPYVWTYYSNSNSITFTRVDRQSPNDISRMTLVTQIPADDQLQLQVLLNKDGETVYIVGRSASGLRLMLANLADENGPPLSDTWLTSSPVIGPAASTFPVDDYDDALSVMYIMEMGVITISSVKGIVGEGGRITRLEMPTTYSLRKQTLYGEYEDPYQSNHLVTLTTNYLNGRIVYLLYVTASAQIRVIKIYYHDQTPVILWNTRLGTIDYFYGVGQAAGGIKLLCDTNGKIYVFIRNGVTGILSTWVIDEYIIDMGHSEGSIKAPISTIPELLDTLRDNYSITGSGDVDDVVIGGVIEHGRDLEIRFDYVDYDRLAHFDDAREEMRLTIAQAFRVLYENSNIHIYDVDSGTIPGGSEDHIIFRVPRGTLLKPCVVRGTEILVGESRISPIETIKPGDYIISQTGKPVKVIEHHSTRIWCQEHNAPYCIPVNFFGEGRPYMQLLISGDHGILLQESPKVRIVHAQDIKCLKRVLNGQEVEYHHLLLEGHESNFYIANGLEVDSMHPDP
jgi:hypothetical protein